MEFDELQKVWDAQTNQPLWVINENALHNRILVKKEQASHRTNFSELLLIAVNFGAGSLVLGLNAVKPPQSVFLYLMAAWMFVVAFYVLISRIRRLQGENKFDRSMLGELTHATSMATYQVRLSQLMRWNSLPIGVLILLSVWEAGKSVWLALGLLIFFIVAHFIGGWEHGIYSAKKRELEILQKKLVNEEVNAD